MGEFRQVLDETLCLFICRDVRPDSPVSTQGPDGNLPIVDEVILEKEPFLLIPAEIPDTLRSDLSRAPPSDRLVR